MTSALDLRAISQLWTVGMLDSVIIGTLITFFAGVVAFTARRQGSGTKFAIWFCALIGIAALPVLGQLGRSQAKSMTSSHVIFQIPETWALYLFMAWAIVSACLLLRIAAALWRVQMIRRNCTLVDTGKLEPQLQSALQGSSDRRILLGVSGCVRVPTAIGLGQPLIVMPHWAMCELSPADLHQVLLHELAHIRRRDDWTNFIQQIVKALLFFHPAVWWMEKHLALEREMACDEAVLAETGDARSYAECLGNLAERSFLRRSVTLAQAMLGRMRHTSKRVAQILQFDAPVRRAGVWKPAIAAMVGLTIFCGIGISKRPQWIAFENGHSQTAKEVASASTSNRTMSGAAAEHLVNGSVDPQVRVIPAKLLGRRPQPKVRRTDMKSGPAKPPANLLHVASGRSTVPVVETLFVVIQEGPSQQQVYQIQMLRWLVLEQDVNQKFPRKQI